MRTQNSTFVMYVGMSSMGSVIKNKQPNVGGQESSKNGVKRKERTKIGKRRGNVQPLNRWTAKTTSLLKSWPATVAKESVLLEPEWSTIIPPPDQKRIGEKKNHH